jgi:hypothetical protein
MANHSFQLMLDGVPYEVKAQPFQFNEGTRYSVAFNGSSEYIFAWDDNAGQYIAIDSDSSDIPANVESAIAQQLQRIPVKIS